MATSAGKTKVEAYPADRDRLNELARLLTAHGPGGMFGQAETLRWLLDQRQRELDAENEQEAAS